MDWFIRIVSERFDVSREVDEGRDEGRARERWECSVLEYGVLLCPVLRQETVTEMRHSCISPHVS